MIHYGWTIAAFIIGGSFGFFLAALCNVSAKAEKEAERDMLNK